MRLVLLVVAAGTALSTPAHALCTTASLAGNWQVGIQSSVCSLTIAKTGKITGKCDSSSVSGSVTLTAPTCQAKGVLMGESFVGRTESIASTRDLPNMILGKSESFSFTALRR